MSSTRPSIADPELLKRVRRIEIRTRRIVTETLAGSYHSAFRGRGMEFAEVREYQPGDDIRTIDWNVTSRSSKPERKLYVKQFTEERELTVILLADVSGSTAFGTGQRLKREVLAEISALLAFAAIRNRDRVGLIRFSDHVEQYVPPRHGSTHVLRVVREILNPGAESRGTDIASALSFLMRVQRRPCVAFLLSDLMSPDFERTLKTVARRHDLIVINVGDRSERAFPNVGLIHLEDAESGTRRLLDTSSRRVRRVLEQAAGEHRSRVDDLLSRSRVDHLELDASEAYERTLERYFRARSARMPR